MPIITDNRPTHYEYVILSNHVYSGKPIQEESEDNPVPKLPNWQIEKTQMGASSYFGAIYVNHKTHQVVLAHRGTNSIGALWEDIKGIFSNNALSTQRQEIFIFIDEAIKLAKKYKAQLSFTGHSLGAFLAELSVYYCHRSKNYPAVSAVTFESPGCLESLEELQANQTQGKIDLEKLDIISYLSYPNLVNTCNHHVGTLYALGPYVGNYAWVNGWHLKQVHTMNHIVDLFEKKDFDAPLILDWPMGNQRTYFFQYAQLKDGLYLLPKEQEEELKSGKQKFTLDYQGHYTLSELYHHKNMLPLIHFVPEMQEWLEAFSSGLWCYLKIHNFNQEQFTNAFIKYGQEQQIKEELMVNLVATSIIKLQNGIKLFCVLPNNMTVWEARKELTKLLEENKEAAGKLLAFVTGTVKAVKKGEIKAELIEKGGELGKTGLINEALVIGTREVFPEGASEDDIRHLKEITEHFMKVVAERGVTVTARGIANGAIMNGIINKLTVIGHETTAVPRYSDSNEVDFAKLARQQQVRERFIQAAVPSTKVEEHKSKETERDIPTKK